MISSGFECTCPLFRTGSKAGETQRDVFPNVESDMPKVNLVQLNRQERRLTAQVIFEVKMAVHQYAGRIEDDMEFNQENHNSVTGK